MKLPLRLTLAVLIGASSARAQQTVLPLWPHGTPEPAQTTGPERDITTSTDWLISGHRTRRLVNITEPTLSVFPPKGKNNGAAALVFPGGAYRMLAWDGEGIDACSWLNSLGMTCLLVKYRVPEEGHYPANFADLEDAQQAMRLARAHAPEWHIDPFRIGAMGFSAGAHLSVVLAAHFDDAHVDTTPARQDANSAIDARPAFVLLVYPAYLDTPNRNIPDRKTLDHPALDPVLTPSAATPPTFLLQAENDGEYVESSLVYYPALKDAHVPAEMHLFATGGHGFGMHPVGTLEENWTLLAAAWLRSIKMLPPLPSRSAGTGAPEDLSASPSAAPCAAEPPTPTHPDVSNPAETPCANTHP